uniref:Neur_chan_LBD domain-containing protein n=1 Tax=Panagrellus redivivus TaxID=6233 RepID=A0A7E4UX23_PANRE
MCNSVIVFLVFFTELVVCVAQLGLQEYIKGKIDKSGYPNGLVFNKTLGPSRVNVILSYPKLLAISESKHTMTTTFELRLEWTYSTLSWNPRHFSDIEHVIYPKKLLPLPDVSLINTPETVSSTISQNYFVKITNVGKITQSTVMSVTTVCDIDLAAFPFDNQTCSIDFTSFLFNSQEQSFLPQIVADYSYNMGNSEWRVDNLFAYIQQYDQGQGSERFEMASFVFNISRNANIFVIMFIFPLYFCNVLLIFGLFQPVIAYENYIDIVHIHVLYANRQRDYNEDADHGLLFRNQ